MERNWTDAQLAAITTPDKTLLVSAAAGSGKTAALTERIIRSLTARKDPKDISKMLIVTYTRAAAAELRQRIFKELTEELSKALESGSENAGYLSEQLIALSSAKICTIDSFYLDVVRRGFDKLGISPSFRTADGAEIDVLAKSVMEEVIDEFYEKDRERFSHIAECFVGFRNAANLSNVFLSLYNKTLSLPEGIGLIRESADNARRSASVDLFDTPWGKELRIGVMNEAKYLSIEFGRYADKCLNTEGLTPYSKAFESDKCFIDGFISLLGHGSYVKAQEYVSSYSPARLGSAKSASESEKEKMRKAREKLKKRITGIKEKSFAGSTESISRLMLATADVTDGVYELLSVFSERIDKEKKQRGICSFNDVRRYALELLIKDEKPTETARAYADFFSDIYIDEYQDVDRVQDNIFRAIAKPDARFMVGDIKQSIYRFRGAEPDVFSEYRRSFPAINDTDSENSVEATVFMSNNFRCDRPVIDFTNNVCSFIFSACAESMGYTHADDLVYTKKQEDKLLPDVPVKVSILTPPDNKENDVDDKYLCEARYVAGQIKTLLDGGRLSNARRVRPEDVAVLFRSNAAAEILKKALGELDIPATDSVGSSYFESPDVLLMLCLLNVIDNPQRDIHLAGLLRSPFFDFSMDELVEIRKSTDTSVSLYDALCAYKQGAGELAEKCAAFDKRLSEFRDRSVALSVDKLIQYLYSTDLFAANGLVNNNENNNLLRLYEYARKYENGSFKGLYSFIVYINKLIEEGKQFENETVSVVEGKVTLMNIHKSKGLEFPICFLYAMGTQMNKKDIKDSLVCDTSLGIAMKIADPTGLGRINTPMRDALVKRIDRRNTEEEMRILYVALTRAKERLYLSTCSSKSENDVLEAADISHRYSCDYTILSATSYIDWILSSIDQSKQNDFCRICFVKRDEINGAIEEFKNEILAECTISPKEPSEKSEKTNEAHPAALDEIKKTLSERFSFVYPYIEATNLPAKISVSRLLPETKNEQSDEELKSLFTDTDAGEYIAPAILRGKTDDVGVTPAMRGTATHLFLQFCDFALTEKNGVDSEISRLIEKGFIPEDSEALIFKDEVAAFFGSALFDKVKRARRVIREQRFNILFPPSVLSTDERFLRETSGEELAVQGVIDLLIEDENGELILCDYKTDRLKKEERESIDALKAKMSERHAKQLVYYAEAVKKLYSKKPASVLVYSTHAKASVEIDV